MLRDSTHVARRVALIAVLIGLLLLSACGQSRFTSARTAENVQNIADALDAQINGTATEREAAHYLGWRAINDPIGDCMSQHGFYFHPTYVRTNAGYQAHGTSGTTWLGEPNLRIVSQLAQGRVLAARVLDKEESSPPAEGSTESTREYKLALKSCEELAGDPGELAEPASVAPLRGELNSVVFALDDSLGDPSSYASCMSDHGIDLQADDVEGYSAMTLYLWRQLPPASQIQAPGEEPTAEWQAFLETEGASLDADAACRQSTYEEGMVELGPQLEEFQTTHADDIAKVHNDWEALVQQAESEGWTP